MQQRATRFQLDGIGGVGVFTVRNDGYASDGTGSAAFVSLVPSGSSCGANSARLGSVFGREPPALSTKLL